jgi:hypothetical protein
MVKIINGMKQYKIGIYMFDNWLKSWEDLFTYDNWKKEAVKLNKKITKFWEDAYKDIFKK